AAFLCRRERPVLPSATTPRRVTICQPTPAAFPISHSAESPNVERTTHAPRNGSSRQRILLSLVAVAIALVVVTASIIATVPEATAVTIYASDSFGRTASNGWGTADAGGAWTIAGTAAHWSVSPGSGNI